MKPPLAAVTAAAMLVVGVAGLGAQDAAGKKQIDGTWELVAVTSGGEIIRDDLVDKSTITFAAGSLTIRRVRKDGSVKQSTGQYTLDTTKSPHWIDMRSDSAGQKKSELGLVEVKGDMLRIALGWPGGDRPTELASKKGERTDVLELRRVR